MAAITICRLVYIALIFGVEASFHFPDRAQLELSDVLNKNCGHTEYEERERPPEGRPRESPWLALFYYPNEEIHFCHGTLITQKHVLTTAVCASNLVENETTIVLGEYDLSTTQDCEGVVCSDLVENRMVLKTIVHENFTQDAFENDLAIVVLDHEVPLTDWIKPICLPIIRFEIGQLSQPNVYNTLWTSKDRPQQYWMSYVDLKKCKQLIGNRVDLSVGQICARSYGNYTIEMVGGAGSALEVEYHNRVYHVGMLSIGILDAGKGTPYVYVDLPMFTKWIHYTVKNN